MPLRILLGEGDALLGDALQTGLREVGFLVDWVRHGDAAEHELRAQAYAAAVLDLSLPLRDGMEIFAAVKRLRKSVPLLLLAPRDAMPERIGALDFAATDFVLKPVNLYELVARLTTLIESTRSPLQTCLVMHGIAVYPTSRSVTLNGAVIALAVREFDLLYALMLNAGRVLTRDQLEQHLYSGGKGVDSNVVEVHIHHLRRKLGSERIQTVRGVGYMMMCAP